MAAVATPSQLGYLLEQTLTDDDPRAVQLLQGAAGVVADYLGVASLGLVEADVVELDPFLNGTVLLPDLPVTAVTAVETTIDGGVTWTARAVGTWTLSKRTGLLTALPGYGRWPTADGSWRVTYTHGWDPIPDTIVSTVLAVAARAWSTTAGVASERIGDYQVTYKGAEGLAPLEQASLDRYRVPRSA